MKGSKKYTYWMASWREDTEARNVHLGAAGSYPKQRLSRRPGS